MLQMQLLVGCSWALIDECARRMASHKVLLHVYSHACNAHCTCIALAAQRSTHPKFLSPRTVVHLERLDVRIIQRSVTDSYCDRPVTAVAARVCESKHRSSLAFAFACASAVYSMHERAPNLVRMPTE